jgi:hypothetical protein
VRKRRTFVPPEIIVSEFRQNFVNVSLDAIINGECGIGCNTTPIGIPAVHRGRDVKHDPDAADGIALGVLELLRLL